ncbi:hypothetical protein INR49_029607 [Caranx melampygus]|nr:hypothetical protein INR49_029607 [Caranx melampygus]
MGDGLHSITLEGGHAGIAIKQPLTAHTTPEQLSDELWQGRGGGRDSPRADDAPLLPPPPAAEGRRDAG